MPKGQRSLTVEEEDLIAGKIEDITAYMLSQQRPLRYALELVDTINRHGLTRERLTLLTDALVRAADNDEPALVKLRELRSFR